MICFLYFINLNIMKGINRVAQILTIPLLLSACSKSAPTAIDSPLDTESALSADMTVDLVKEIGFTPAQAAELISNRTNLATSLGMALEDCSSDDCEGFAATHETNIAITNIQSACALLLGKLHISGTIDEPETQKCFDAVAGTGNIDCDKFSCD